MTLFDAYPAYSMFRPLSDKTPMIVGTDVFALQTALAGAGYPCGPHDGYLGPATGKAIWQFQTGEGLVKDGIAGPATNNRLVALLAAPQTSSRHLPPGLLLGHLAHESSLYPGCYSPRRDDGSYDAGIAQRNTAHTAPAEGFDTPTSIAALATNERKAYDKFVGVTGRRRWLLATGHWNAPAYASYIAREEGASLVRTVDIAKPSAAARAALEAYMVASTVMMA